MSYKENKCVFLTVKTQNNLVKNINKLHIPLFGSMSLNSAKIIQKTRESKLPTTLITF